MKKSHLLDKKTIITVLVTLLQSLVVITVVSAAVVYTYDSSNHLTTIFNDLGGKSIFTMDNNGNETQRTYSIAESNGNAQPSDVLLGKTFTNNSGSQTGTIPIYTPGTEVAADNKSVVPGKAYLTPPSGTYFNGGSVYSSEPDLLASNIVSGKTIFGVTGTAYPPSVPHNSQVFTASGTFTVPANVFEINIIATGGGGAGGANGGGSSRGGGGGAGGTCFGQVAVTPGQQIAVTVGSGGTTGSGGDSSAAGCSGYGGAGGGYIDAGNYTGPGGLGGTFSTTYGANGKDGLSGYSGGTGASAPYGAGGNGGPNAGNPGSGTAGRVVIIW